MGVLASRNSATATIRQVAASSARRFSRPIQAGGSGARRRLWTNAKNMPTANQSMKLGSHMLTTVNSPTGVRVRRSSQANASPPHAASVHNWRLVLAATSPRWRRPIHQAMAGSTR